MTTALTTLQTAQLPAFLQGSSELLALNDSALGGIKGGSFPRISIKGAKFFIVDKSAEQERVLITAQQADGTALPAMALDSVILAANPGLSKKFYDGAFDPDDADKEPDCQSDDGITPSSHITSPVHTHCATCPKNAWGSKVNEQNGKESKACSDSKQLVIVPSADLKYKALGLGVTASALKEYGAYVRTLSARKIPIVGVVTRITFDPEASYPKLQFTFLRFLTAEEFAIVQERIASDEVKNIVTPQRVVSIQPAPAATPPVQASVSMPDPTQHNLAAAVQAAAQAAVANAAVTPVDKNAAEAASKVIAFPGTTSAPPAAAPAAQGGFGTSPAPAGGADAKQPKGRTKKTEQPGAGVDAAVVAAAAATAGLPDINTIPEPFKAAIIASGGLSSVAGAAIYAAMPKAAPAAPVQPATTFANAGTATVASGGDLNAQLTALLGKK
jgi:hypothetical protein